MNKEISFWLGEIPVKKNLTTDQIDKAMLPLMNKVELMNNSKLIIQSKAKLETFKQFIDFIINGKPPDIDKNNISEFISLSNEIGSEMAQTFFTDSMKKIGLKDNLLDDIIENKKEAIDNFALEKQIAIDLEYYIENHSEKLRQVPITTLYNVFNHKSRHLSNHDNAYEFIINSLKDANELEREQFCALINTLDGTKMSEEMINDAFVKKSEHFGYIPDMPDNFFAKLKDKADSCEQKYIEIEKQFKSIKAELESTIANIKQQADDDVNKIINEERQKIEKTFADEMRTQIEAQSLKFDNIQRDQIEQLTIGIKENKESFAKLSGAQDNLKNEINKLIINQEEMNKRIDQLFSEKAESDQKMADLQKSQEGFNLKIGSLLTEKKEAPPSQPKASQLLDQEIADLKRNQKDIYRKISDLTIKQTKIPPLAAKPSRSSADESKIQPVNQIQIDTMKNLNELKENQRKIDTTIKDLTNKQVEYNKSISKIEQNQKDINQRLLALEGNNNDTKEEAQPNEAKQPRTISRVAEYHKKMSEKRSGNSDQNKESPTKHDINQSNSTGISSGFTGSSLRTSQGPSIQVLSQSSSSRRSESNPKAKGPYHLYSTNISTLEINGKFNFENISQYINSNDEVILHIQYAGLDSNLDRLKFTIDKAEAIKEQSKKVKLLLEINSDFKENTFPKYLIFDQLEITSNVKFLKPGLFSKSKALTSLEISTSLICIPRDLFKNCTSLKKVTFSVKDPKAELSINDSAFYGCSSLTEITFPPKLKKIGNLAFSLCSSLLKITFPQESGFQIGNSAFKSCSKLTEVNIPSNCIKIGDSAFNDCRFLNKITVPASIIPTENEVSRIANNKNLTINII